MSFDCIKESRPANPMMTQDCKGTPEGCAQKPKTAMRWSAGQAAEKATQEKAWGPNRSSRLFNTLAPHIPSVFEFLILARLDST